MKLDKLNTAGKDRKALADRRSTNLPAAGASKDVDLKQKSAMKGNEIKKNQMALGKQHAAAADRTTNKHHILTDEEIKQCYEWAKDGIEEMRGYSWSAKEERKLLMNLTISEIMASAIGVPISELEQPFLVFGQYPRL